MEYDNGKYYKNIELSKDKKKNSPETLTGKGNTHAETVFIPDKLVFMTKGRRINK